MGERMTDDDVPPSRRERDAERAMRMDFINEVVSVDETTGVMRMRFTPDPRRYEHVRRDDGVWYVDRYLNTAMRLETLVEAFVAPLPMFASGRTVSSASEYSLKRLAAVADQLETGVYVAPGELAARHVPLPEVGTERDLSFLSVDICGSSARRRRDPEGFSEACRILIQEMGAVVGQFQGTILKTTGDGFVAYVDLPSFTVAVDTTIDLAGTLLHVLSNAINPALARRSIEPLMVRIGADYGSAKVSDSRVPLTGFVQRDVASDALNRAVKIERSCRPGTVRIGGDMYERAHVQWLERCVEVEFDGSAVGIPGYRVFEVS